MQGMMETEDGSTIGCGDSCCEILKVSHDLQLQPPIDNRLR